MRTNITNWSRIALGTFLILYTLNQFFHFVPMSYSEMPEEAENFLVTYLPLLYIFEIIVGLFLIFNKWRSFILIVLAQLSLSFLIFTYANSVLARVYRGGTELFFAF